MAEHDQSNDAATTEDQATPPEATADDSPYSSADAGQPTGEATEAPAEQDEPVESSEATGEEAASEPLLVTAEVAVPIFEVADETDAGDSDKEPVIDKAAGLGRTLKPARSVAEPGDTGEDATDGSDLDVMTDRVAGKVPDLQVSREVIKQASPDEPPAKPEPEPVSEPEPETVVAEPDVASNPATVEAAVSVNVDVDINTIDTSALEDIDRLVSTGLGADVRLTEEQLGRLLDGELVKPDETSLASDDFWSKPGTMLTENSGLVYVTHPITGAVSFEFARNYVKEGEGPTVSVVAELANGDVVTRNSVGDVIWAYPNGDKDIAFGDGSVWQMFADGTVIVVHDSNDPAPGDSGGESAGTSATGEESGSTANAEQNQSSDDSDDDDDDSGQQAESDEAAPADASEETDEDGGEEEQKGTPNPANEDRNDGPPLAFVTGGRLGQDEVRNAEKAVNVATGGGHTTPSGDDAGQAPIEFLTSEVGRAQFRADQRAIEAQSGQDSTPAEGSERPSNVPTVEDMRNLEFIAAGGGLINPVKESSPSGIDGGNIGGSPQADNLHLDMLDSSLIGNIDASIASDMLDEDTAEKIKSVDLDDIS